MVTQLAAPPHCICKSTSCKSHLSQHSVYGGDQKALSHPNEDSDCYQSLDAVC